MELRMYTLVLYNISPIQQGIQAYHATIEALNHFNDARSIEKELYFDWCRNWKTVIILNGGSTSTMLEHLNELTAMNVGRSYFIEPDLNNSLTAISFIVDERVFNKTKYPDSSDEIWIDDEDEISYVNMGGIKNLKLREFLSKFKLA